MVDRAKILTTKASVTKTSASMSAHVPLSLEARQDIPEEMTTQGCGNDRNACHPQGQLHLIGYREPKPTSP